MSHCHAPPTRVWRHGHRIAQAYIIKYHHERACFMESTCLKSLFSTLSLHSTSGQVRLTPGSIQPPSTQLPQHEAQNRSFDEIFLPHPHLLHPPLPRHPLPPTSRGLRPPRHPARPRPNMLLPHHRPLHPHPANIHLLPLPLRLEQTLGRRILRAAPLFLDRRHETP